MEVVFQRKTLLAAMIRAAAVCETKTTIPILGCLKVSLSDGVMDIRTTDSSSFFRCAVDVESIRDGTDDDFAFPRERAIGFLSAVHDETVKLSFSARYLDISTASARARISLMPAAELPWAEPPQPGAIFPIDRLGETLRKLYWAFNIGSSFANHALKLECENGPIHASINANPCFVVANLGEPETSASFEAAITEKQARALATTFPGAAMIGPSASWLIVADADGARLALKTVPAGKVPWRQFFLRESWPTKFTAPARDLSAALSSVLMFSDEIRVTRSRAIDLKVSAGALSITANSYGDEASVSVPVQGDSNGQGVIINGAFLRSALAACDGEASICWDDPARTPLIVSCGNVQHGITLLTRVKG